MSRIDTTNTTTNINSNLNIDETQGGKLAKAISDKLGTDSGITSVSYTNGKLEIKHTLGSIDALANKLQELAFSNAEMKAILGENVSNVSFKLNDNGEITLSTTDAAGKTTSKTGSISDFDIRELMKLLISAFSELRTADRDRALNVLNATVAALDTKIAAMEDAKEEQFKSALTSAIGSIVSGVCSIGMTAIGTAVSVKGLNKSYSVEPEFQVVNGAREMVNIQEVNVAKAAGEKVSTIGHAISSSAQGVGQIVNGTNGAIAAAYSAGKAEADIEATKADALLEILRQAQEQYSKGNDSLQQFIDKVLNIMQQLLQSASQTEKSVTAI